MTTPRHASPVLACLALLVVLAACGESQPATPGATVAPPVASPTRAGIASPSPASEPSDPASASASPPRAATYASDGFALPFSLTPPSWAADEPDTAESNFITWNASDADLAVRVLVPVSVYLPGEGTASDMPADYLAYLDTLTDHGVTVADRTTTTVAGHPATLMTITTADSVDGALGCPSANTTAEDCYGPQPDLALRIAVIDVDGTPLLVWLRTANGTDASAAIAEFEAMLQTIELR